MCLNEIGEISSKKKSDVLKDIGTIYGLETYGVNENYILVLTWEGYLISYKIILGKKSNHFILKKLRKVEIPKNGLNENSSCLDVCEDNKIFAVFQVYQIHQYGKFYTCFLRIFEIFNGNFILRKTIDLRNESIDRIMSCAFLPDFGDLKAFVGVSDHGIKKDVVKVVFNLGKFDVFFEKNSEDIGLVSRLVRLSDGVYCVDDVNSVIRFFVFGG